MIMATQTATAGAGWERPNRRSVVYHVCVGLLSIVMIYPLLWLIASSFKPAQEIFANASSLIPQHPTFSNYTEGWSGLGGVTFGTFLKNSFILAGVGTLGAVISSALVAYGFARLNFVGK